jgi:hypothetical protein
MVADDAAGAWEGPVIVTDDASDRLAIVRRS